MINVGTGNLLLQDDDMSVPHKGIALAFRRTYNSQSQHDVNGTDGSAPSMYGNGWTTTFDAHLSSSAPNVTTVWDIDGAHYDYTLASDGVTWTPPTGQHATLTWDRGCGYLWTKKSGTSYYFWQAPNGPCGPSYGGLYAGKLYQIIGRNRNTYVTFGYSWDIGTHTAGDKVSAISATAESDITATLYFADVSGHRLLDHITFPDGTTSVSYGYDTLGNLTSVSRPPNNAAGIRPVQTYGYYTTGGLLSWAASPRWNGPDGGGLFAIGYDGTTAPTATVNSMGHVGVVNPSIPDGTGTPLQSGYSSSAVTYVQDWYGTGGPTPWFHDSDGHSTNWVMDAQRPIQTQVCTAMVGWNCTGTWLVSNETWDQSTNNLVSEVDPRGNETDYLHDPMGNTTAVGEPYTTTSVGSFKPTKLYDYDAFNNVVAYCAETETHAAGSDWTGTPTSQSDSLCTSQAGTVPHWRATFVTPSSEPYGELASMTTPMGYSRQFSYAATQQGGNDYGLPTSVSGDSFAQLDSTTITPTQSFWYDAQGSLRCYSKGQGTYVLSYDALGRLVSEADPDDSSANASSICGKSTGQTGWNTQTTTSYFPDGSKQSSQTPSERSFGVSSTFTYDLDDNVLTTTQHHGCVTGQSCANGVTQKWYDGADRLVEVAQPHDARAFTDLPEPYDGDRWITRYLYDLSQGSTVTTTSSPAFRAYGDLYKTQTYSPADGGWTDVRGSAFDALNRETSKYSYTVGGHQFETTTLQYDLDATSLGLLAKKTNPNSESVTYAYDAHNRVTSETYAGDAAVTPGETYVYDPSGRKSSVTSSQFGVEQYAYDNDGRLVRVAEPTGGGLTSPARISYGYYGNGQRSAVSIASAGMNQTNALSYAYRADGLLRVQAVSAFANGGWYRNYTDAGRLSTVTGADAQTLTYDSSGQLATYAVTGGTANYTHDPEGSVLTEAFSTVIFPGSGATPETLTNTVNIRGELIDRGNSLNSGVHTRTRTNAGCLISTTIPYDLSTYDASSDPTTDAGACDRVNGVPLSPGAGGSAAVYNGQTYPQGTNNIVTFDATGRETKTITTRYMFVEGVTGQTGGQHTSPSSATTQQLTTTRGYDVENHLRSLQYASKTTHTNADTLQSTTTTVGPGAPTPIYWGPNGHPIRIPWYTIQLSPSLDVPTQSGFLTLHWDGDVILFVTDDSGNVVDFRIGLDGDITPRDPNFTGLSVYDRDAAGVIVQTSNATGNTGFNPLDPSTTSGPAATGSTGFKAPNVPAQYARSDGFAVANGIQINGVRAFDSNLGAWTTPDAFEGDIHDPASQQKYMWNLGNAVEYSDPSGYLTLTQWWRMIFHGECPAPEVSEKERATMQWNAKYLPDAGGIEMPLDRITQLPKSRGDPPKGDDGKPLELHHRNQNPNGPIDEMTQTEHRLGENFRKNHENTGQSESSVDHGPWWRQHVRDHWKAWWDRFMPERGDTPKQ